MNFGLRGKVALVTAASQGLGLACAEALAAEGCGVAICARDSERVADAAERLRHSSRARIEGLQCDLRRREDRDELIRRVEATFRKVDVLVFNHGNPPPGNFESVTSARWEEGIDLSLRPALHLCQALVPGMRHRGWGRIVFLSSAFAREPDPAYVVSATLRAGLLGLAKCLARELAPHGVTVNTVLAGYFSTPLLQALAEEDGVRAGVPAQAVLESWAQQVPVGSIGDGRMLGQLVAWLCSECSQNIVGAAIPCDGGLLRATT